MLNKLSFNIFNELNESESKKYKVKKRVLIESDGIKTIKENLGLVKIEFECNECGHNWIEDYEDYFSDEDELNEILENGDGSIDCPECGGNDIKWKDVNIIEENKSVCEKCGKEPCECDKTLNEKDSEKLGGDPNDFISDVQTILDTLSQIDTSSFGTKLAQQMIEDWVETCKRQIQKGKRLASGDEFYSESSLTEDDNDIMRLVKKSIKNGKLPDEIKYKGKIYKSFYVMNSDNSGETSDIYYCNMENTPSGDPQESNDYFFVKVALNKTDRGYNGIKEIRFVEDLTESSLTEDSLKEDEYGDNPIKTNDKYQLYKSMKGTDIDGVTYSSYLVRDNNGNGVRSFIAKNDIEAERKFNESSINEDSIEDAKNDSIKKGLYSESSTSLRDKNSGIIFSKNDLKKGWEEELKDTLEPGESLEDRKKANPFNKYIQDLIDTNDFEVIEEAEENTEIDWDKPRYGDDILNNMWTAVCSNDLNYVKNAFNKKIPIGN